MGSGTLTLFSFYSMAVSEKKKEVIIGKVLKKLTRITEAMILKNYFRVQFSGDFRDMFGICPEDAPNTFGVYLEHFRDMCVFDMELCQKMELEFLSF